MAKEKKIKVLLAQFPLETHSRGLITVAGMLRDAGMEVVLMGNARPEQIAKVAVQESADVIGISTYCGGELVLGAELLKAAEKEGIKDHTAFVLGGIFPPKDGPELVKMGFSAVFPPSTPKNEIVGGVKKAVAAKQGH
jgi:methylmalonyl-CoA mutase cobalamin-binding domain/chain